MPPEAAAGLRLVSLIDGEWYLQENPDVAQAGIDPRVHFLTHGWREGRDPNPYFQTAWYQARHPESGVDGAMPLLHYALAGEEAGVQPGQLFDPHWYRRKYGLPEGTSPLGHFLRHRHGGRLSPNRHFDAEFYLAENLDVAAAGRDPAAHFYTTGLAEGRLPRRAEAIAADSGLFDANFYLINAGDILEAGADPLEHFCRTGWKEGRKPNPYFDPGWYLRTHGQESGLAPLVHYILKGEENGLRPCPHFDPAWYSRTYRLPCGTSPLRHYLEHRRSQRYSPNPEFDVDHYVGRYRDSLRPHRDPFGHFLAIGVGRGFIPSARG